ncbi:hypothetical protein [Leifsonia sp. fls2-241-R2A-40a]|uniref:hypothetical protein n=1 Tax=Leifsonia sp. fls2-241-R2A-40a TaxID=3040290 RepID=UPI0025507475|nr:hypothetical protein [Leifsonia sp. fls2-241-R2A-40a]
MRHLVATLLAPGEGGYPQVLDIPMPAGETEAPIRLKLPIDTPDGPQYELWELCERTSDETASYRLAQIISR